MPITDPEAIAFSEQYTRPMAEMIRWLQASGNEMAAQWNGGVSAKFSNDAEIVQDANVDNNPFTGANAHTIMTRVTALVAVLNAANAMDGVLPATVRALGPASGPAG